MPGVMVDGRDSQNRDCAVCVGTKLGSGGGGHLFRERGPTGPRRMYMAW